MAKFPPEGSTGTQDAASQSDGHPPELEEDLDAEEQALQSQSDAGAVPAAAPVAAALANGAEVRLVDPHLQRELEKRLRQAALLKPALEAEYRKRDEKKSEEEKDSDQKAAEEMVQVLLRDDPLDQVRVRAPRPPAPGDQEPGATAPTVVGPEDSKSAKRRAQSAAVRKEGGVKKAVKKGLSFFGIGEDDED